MSEKKRILFVDDDPNILHGLKRMLHPLRREWNMDFVESGEAALAILADKPFDVIVSDMRMPGMDGAELLWEVMRLYPRITRIALSGQSDKELTLQAVGPTHQYLAKPCDAETLKDTIARTSALRELLANDELQKIISGISILPSLPKLYLELLDEFKSGTASLARVSQIISEDISMTAKILQLVNSHYFGIGQTVSSPTEAVVLLGLDTIETLILSIDVFSHIPERWSGPCALGPLWEHSFYVAVFAMQITNVENMGNKMAGQAFAAGLLHDIGKLILASNIPDEYSRCLELKQEKKITQSEAEIEILGASHAQLGAYLLGLWGLPDPIVEAVAYHHTPSQCLGTTFVPLTAVHGADCLTYDQQSGNQDSEAQVDLDYLASLGFCDNFSNWKVLCEITVEEGLLNELQNTLRR